MTAEAKAQPVRRGRFLIDMALLQAALGIPSDHEIIGLTWDFYHQGAYVYVSGPDMPEISVGECVPLFTPAVTEVRDENGEVVRTWDWNW